MRATYRDRENSKTICVHAVKSLGDIPSVGDMLILLPNEDYIKFYKHDNRTCTVVNRIIDYRDDSVDIFVD